MASIRKQWDELQLSPVHFPKRPNNDHSIENIHNQCSIDSFESSQTAAFDAEAADAKKRSLKWSEHWILERNKETSPSILANEWRQQIEERNEGKVWK